MAHTPPGVTREKVYRFVRERLLDGSPPTVREVQEAMGFAAVESARKQLDRLVEEGRLVKQPGRARGYRLAEARPRPSLVPLIGRVRAGALHEAIEAADGHVVVDAAADDLFALRVEGDSMVGAAILPGDLVLVRRGAVPRSGDVVVAMVDGEATVKTFRQRGRRVELHAENPAYPPIVPPADRLSVVGVVVEVRRRLA